ncbi:MAG: hypothetical protein ACYC8T_13985 [Myxococcaceae bacterium]
MTRTLMHPLLLASFVTAFAASAQDPAAPAPVPAPAPAAEPAVSPDQFKALAQEVRRLKLEIGIPDLEYRSHAGMGPAASKVYFVPRGLSIGGYGEVNATFFPEAGKKNETDLLRAVLYAGYRFSDHLVFNSEIEFEHAITTKRGEVAVEFAYLDFIVNRALTVRAGNVLMPVGLLNEVHEPVFFYGVHRPELDRNLLPSTWNENGVGIYGELEGVRYKAYVVNGLQAISNKKCITDSKGTPDDKSDDVKLCDGGNDGFGGSSWIRGGRQRGSKALTENFGGVLALAYERDLFSVGGSAYLGRSGQGAVVDGAVVKGEVFLAEAHAQARWKGLSARAIYALGTLSDSAAISRKQGAVVGSRVQGGYLEAAYNVMTLISPDSEQAVSPFVRFEQMNLHHEVGEGLAKDPALASTTLTAGLSYLPHPNVVVKADFQRRTTRAVNDPGVNQLNLGVGFVY